MEHADPRSGARGGGSGRATRRHGRGRSDLPVCISLRRAHTRFL
jgi:hypothetical protein